MDEGRLKPRNLRTVDVVEGLRSKTLELSIADMVCDLENPLCGDVAKMVVMESHWDARTVYNAVARDTPFGQYLRDRWTNTVMASVVEAQKEWEAGSAVRGLVGIGPKKKQQLNDKGVYNIGELAALMENEPLLLRVQEHVDTEHHELNKGYWQVKKFAALAMGLLTHGMTDAQSDSDNDDTQEWQETPEEVIARDEALLAYDPAHQVIL